MNNNIEDERRKVVYKIDRRGEQIRKILSTTGLWPYEKPTKTYSFRWYLVLLTFLFNVMGIITYIIHNRGNFNIMLSGIGILLSFTIVTIKGLWFRWFPNNILTILKILSQMTEDQISSNNKVWKILNKPMLYYTGVIFPTIFYCGFSMVIVMWLRPTLTMLITHIQGDIKFVRFFPTVYFWTIKPGSFIWLLHFLIELITSWNIVSIGVTTDNLYSYIVSKIIGHYRTLNYEIENTKFDEITKDKIKNFHTRHQNINNICLLFGELIGPFVFVSTLSTAVILCTTIFQISQMESITFSKISWPLVYTLYKLIQVFIYAWGGELINQEGEEFRDAAYSSAWTDTKNNKLISHAVRMMMHQRPILLKACGIKPIRADLFAGLINTTLSYFFLLQTINEKS